MAENQLQTQQFTDAQIAELNQLPAHLQVAESSGAGLGMVTQYLVPPRIKIVQPQSGQDIKSMSREGDVVVVPNKIMVAPLQLDPQTHRPLDIGTPFQFVPIFFYPEWCVWNPYQMKDTLPTIRDRTTNPNDRIAKRAKNSALWSDVCPENKEFRIRFCEHLNFVVMLTGGHELFGTPIVMSFAKSMHRSGTDFLSLINQRGRVDLYGMQFEAATKLFPKDANQYWYKLHVANPAPPVSPWQTSPELHAHLAQLHQQFADAYQSGTLQTEYDDDEGVVDAVTTPNVDPATSQY